MSEDREEDYEDGGENELTMAEEENEEND